jgi:hypothetical protein
MQVCKELMLSYAFPTVQQSGMSGDSFAAFDHPEGSTLVSITLCFGAVVNMVKKSGKRGTTPITDETLFYEWVDKTYLVSSARQAYLRSVVTRARRKSKRRRAS